MVAQVRERIRGEKTGKENNIERDTQRKDRECLREKDRLRETVRQKKKTRR